MSVAQARTADPSPGVARSDDSAFVREAGFATRWNRLVTAVASSRGRQHAVNEDCHSALDGASPLFVVADGVGRGALPSRASRELVSRLHAMLERRSIDAEAVHTAVLLADREIGRSIATQTDVPGAATLVLCASTDVSLSHWIIAWVGDCRVYRVSAANGAPAQLLSRDDTYRHLGERPPPGGSLDDPARMVGNGAVEAPNIRRVELGRDEMLVLCSDGVHKHAEPGDVARLLRGQGTLAGRCLRLIELARARGSSDDATVLVAQRKEHRRARVARLVSIGALIAVAACAILWFAAEQVAAQRNSTGGPHAAQVQS